MLISLNWINEFLGGPDQAPLDADTVSNALTSLGLEVEGIEAHGRLPGIIVGEVRKVSPHPNADKLRCVVVFDGEAEQPVVCGAPNVPEPGGKIAFATVGTMMPAGFEIGARKLRGEDSRGMICSEDELEIGPDSDGIIILPDDFVPGQALADAIPDIADTIIEISVTPNRPDALGHLGVARDLAAKLGRPLVRPAMFEAAKAEGLDTVDGLVTISAGERCGRYHGYTLEGARIGQSPVDMRVRLHRLGLRPINNAVDITNWCLMEFGQPMHAFDRARLAEGRVVVRFAHAGSKMTTLDGQEIELQADDLVIADAAEAQALAGVMGGENSMVEDATSTLLLEVAHFAPAGVRKSARRHGFHTDSSHRFERGTDWGRGLDEAARRALHLFIECTGAKITGRLLVDAPEGHPARPVISLDPARIKGLLGMPVGKDDAQGILEGLDMEVDRSDDALWQCRVPTHRPDLSIEEDLVEEVMRFHGLDNLPAQSVPRVDPPVGSGYGEGWGGFRDRLVDAFAEQGLHELVSLAFTSLDKAQSDAWGAPVLVANPLRQQDAYLRTSLFPGLLDAVKLNMSRHARGLALFEQGRVYAWSEQPTVHSEVTKGVDDELPNERESACFVLAARREHLGAREGVSRLQGILARMGVQATVRNPREAGGEGADPAMHPGVQALCVAASGSTVGQVGELHPDRLDTLDLPRDWCVVIGRVDVQALRAELAGGRTFDELPRHPATSRDLSLDLSDEVGAGTAIEALAAAAGAATVKGAEGVELASGDSSAHAIEYVEDYRGKGISEGRRAILLRLHYRDPTRSVTDEIVQPLHEAIVQGALASLKERDDAVRVR